MAGKSTKTESGRGTLKEQFSRQIAAERQMQKMTQADLAEIIGSKKSNISRMEKGAQNITFDYAEAMARALNKDIRLVMEDAHIDYGNSSVYCLKLFDTELLRFRLSRGIELKAEIISVNEAKKPQLPMDLDLSEEGIISWLKNRTIPSNRELAGRILSSLGLNINDLKGIIDICMGLSLSDSYWVVQADFAGSFDEYNLFENRFSEALGLVAYTGGPYDTRGFKTSPELTTGGMLRKAWRFSESKGIWLYKGGSEGFANAGNEPYCEYYASQIAAKMGLHHVHYELERWKGILASKCRLFTDINTAYVPIGRVIKTGGIGACLEYYKKLGESFYEELVSMLVFDAVIVNEDRHFGNFGLLVDERSGKPVSPAPVFDNGLSLLCYAMKDDFADMDGYISSRSNPYGPGNDYFGLCSRIMGQRQKKELARLIGFRFTESDVSNLPSWRMAALEDMIQKRVRMLLAL